MLQCLAVVIFGDAVHLPCARPSDADELGARQRTDAALEEVPERAAVVAEDPFDVRILVRDFDDSVTWGVLKSVFPWIDKLPDWMLGERLGDWRRAVDRT